MRSSKSQRRVPLEWFKSSYSGSHGECVEVAQGPATGVRDTKHRELGTLFFGADEWRAFVKTAQDNFR
ncbi:hypothetical protein HNR06_000033 [Nocardiopsis arvandica]|uniref:DUF397 domain-containing protein n=1 Tax=Nocardiopsis sinuspersici TaxID=501010 RepID=A0A7Y9X7F3_9ACTN|nr:DUF397 domain-containing protein [Nocardiopsis sinuspersici]NYH50444.1 hypothetical protein [Nocardiopsis sinuspersici]